MSKYKEKIVLAFILDICYTICRNRKEAEQKKARCQMFKYIEELEKDDVFKFLITCVIVGMCVCVLCGCALADPFNSVVDAARSQIGCGERIKNNCGKDVEEYTGGPHVAWCAAFVSWCLVNSDIHTLTYTLRARDIWNEGCRLNMRVKTPRTGDIICFKRGKNPALGHVGIVEYVDENTITTIEGNTGKFPSKVRRITYNRNNIKDLLGYIRAR